MASDSRPGLGLSRFVLSAFVTAGLSWLKALQELRRRDCITAIALAIVKCEPLASFYHGQAAVTKALKTKLRSGKTSRLSEAIAAAADQFKDTPAGTRHIVLVTDGVEGPGGRFNLPGSLKQLNSIQASVHITAIQCVAKTDPKAQPPGERATASNGMATRPAIRSLMAILPFRPVPRALLRSYFYRRMLMRR